LIVRSTSVSTSASLSSVTAIAGHIRHFMSYLSHQWP
jgi:hypothetical protein